MLTRGIRICVLTVVVLADLLSDEPRFVLVVDSKTRIHVDLVHECCVPTEKECSHSTPLHKVMHEEETRKDVCIICVRSQHAHNFDSWIQSVSSAPDNRFGMQIFFSSGKSLVNISLSLSDLRFARKKALLSAGELPLPPMTVYAPQKGAIRIMQRMHTQTVMQGNIVEQENRVHEGEQL